MRELLFYGGTVIVWAGLIGSFLIMKKLRADHGSMNFSRMRELAKSGNDAAKKGVVLVGLAAIGVLAQLASFILDGSL